jgi:hypothetical protein
MDGDAWTTVKKEISTTKQAIGADALSESAFLVLYGGERKW